MSKPTPLRIRMRQLNHPIALEGTVIGYALDGTSFQVKFDHFFPDTTFYTGPGVSSQVATLPPVKVAPTSTSASFPLHMLVPSDAQIWEVLP